jgi:hypothetical protein
VKPLFFILVFANLAFLGWSLFIGQPARELPPINRGPGIPLLKLAVESSAPTQAGAAPVAGKRCVTVGPFLEPAQVDRAAALLRSEHLSPRQRSSEQPSGTAFVVALTAMSQADATRTAMRLRQAGVKDVTTAAAGATATRLNFGSFASHVEAEARVTALRKFGVDPTIVEESRSVPTFWLDVDLGPGDRPVDVAAIQATGGGRGALVLQSCEPPVAAPPAGAPAPNAAA